MKKYICSVGFYYYTIWKKNIPNNEKFSGYEGGK